MTNGLQNRRALLIINALQKMVANDLPKPGAKTAHFALKTTLARRLARGGGKRRSTYPSLPLSAGRATPNKYMTDEELAAGFRKIIARTADARDRFFLVTIQDFLFHFDAVIRAGNRGDYDKVRAIGETAEEKLEATNQRLPPEVVERNKHKGRGKIIVEYRADFKRMRDYSDNFEDVELLNEIDRKLERIEDWLRGR
jgi:hypothetical protein